MTEKLRALLKKTFVDTDIKKAALSVQETNIRHAVAANTVFEHPSKWLLEAELENQCIDWVYQFLVSKEFPERWAAKLSNMTKIRVFSDAKQLDKLKACRGGGAEKGIATEELESYLADVLQNLGRELHSNDFCGEEADDCRLVKDISVHAIKNTRRKMEDKHVVLRHYSDMFALPTGYSFFGVFDGHGGVDAARFTSTHLSGILSKYLKENCPGETTGPRNSFKQIPNTPNQSPNKTPQAKTNLRSTSLLVPQLSKECRKSFDNLKDPNLQSEPKLTKIQRNSYHESDSRRKNPVPKEPSPLAGRGAGGGDECQGVRTALEKSFLETNRIFCERAKIENNNSGCTAVCLLMEEEKKKFHVAWVGDSQALLVRDGKPVEIMLPHKPEREDERARIIALGGTVVHIGAWRVNGTLSVSRAIGDIGHKPYITSQPDIESYDVQSGDEYLVLACDGLWDVLSYDDVISHVANHLIVEKKERKSVAQSLVRAAKDKGSSDNITVMVIFLREDSPLVSTSQTANRDSKITNDSSKSGDDKSGNRDSVNPAGDAPHKDANSNPKQPEKSSGEFSKLSLKSRQLFEADDILAGEKRETSEGNLKQDKTETQFLRDDQRNVAENVIVNKITWKQPEWSPKTESEEVVISDSTNNDSKENYLTSSSELPLEFSPLRSEVKEETEGNSTCSIKSRVKRSPKISSSTEDKEDKENIDLRLKMCLKTDVSPSSSDASQRMTDTTSRAKKLPRDSKLRPSLKGELKETNAEVKKGTLLAQTPDSKDNVQHFRVPPSGKQKHPTNLHVPKGNVSQYPPKQPFTSASSVSVGFLKDAYRKFSQTSSHLKKLDLTPTSCRPATNFGSCSFAEHSQAKGRACQERWAVAIETGEDLEGMFECGEWEATGLNVSSSRW